MDAAPQALSLTETAPAAFHAAPGYPSLRSVTTGVLTGVEREGSGRSPSRAAYQRAWRKAHPSKAKEYQDRYNAKHPGVSEERQKRYRAQSKNRRDAYNQIYADANREHVRRLNRRGSSRARAALSDRYLRNLLAASMKNHKPKDIPEPLVAAYRDYLNLKRLCRKSQTSTH